MDLLQLLLEDLAIKSDADHDRLLSLIREELEVTERQAEIYVQRYRLLAPNNLDRGY